MNYKEVPNNFPKNILTRAYDHAIVRPNYRSRIPIRYSPGLEVLVVVSGDKQFSLGNVSLSLLNYME